MSVDWIHRKAFCPFLEYVIIIAETETASHGHKICFLPWLVDGCTTADFFSLVFQSFRLQSCKPSMDHKTWKFGNYLIASRILIDCIGKKVLIVITNTLWYLLTYYIDCLALCVLDERIKLSAHHKYCVVIAAVSVKVGFVPFRGFPKNHHVTHP